MDAWLRTEGADKGESFAFRFVRSPPASNADDREQCPEAMHVAKREYPDYAWEMESGFKSGEFYMDRRNTRNRKAPVPAGAS
jgi:hypothetical protein